MSVGHAILPLYQSREISYFSVMKNAVNIIRRILEIREGEFFRATVMFAYIFSVIAALMVIKPVRNSLFLIHLGIENLPYAFVLVAIASGIIVSVYTKFSKTIRVHIMIGTSMVATISSLFIIWILLRFSIVDTWFLYLFYVWVAIFGVVLTTQFWLLANYIFNAREAKRLFGPIGAGAISGGIFGGYLTNYLAPIFGTANLIFISMALLAISLLAFIIIWLKSGKYNYRERIKAQKRTRHSIITDNPLKLFMRSRHLTFTAILVGIGVISANLVDYQYSAIASNVISDEDKLTAFFGFWLSNLSVAALAIQLLFTGRILRAVGVVGSLIFLPAGILMGGLATMLSPNLWSAVFIKVSEGGLKHSINKAGLELLSMPIPPLVKNQAKTIIGVFVDSLAMGIGGLTLIILTTGIGIPVEYISILIFVLIAIWLIVIVKLRKEYINSFRQAIERRTLDIDEQSLKQADLSMFKSVLKYLDGDNERQILYVLTLVEGIKSESLLPHLRKLIRHSSAAIRTQALRTIIQLNTDDFLEEANGLFFDDNQEVQVEALRYLCLRSGDRESTLKKYAFHPDDRVRTAAIVCATSEIAVNREFGENIDVDGIFKSFLGRIDWTDSLGESSVNTRINAAMVAGVMNKPEANTILRRLLQDKSIGVLRAAIRSAAQIRSPEFIPLLISLLGIREVGIEAREGLAEYGDSAVDQLVEMFESADNDLRIRIRIPKVLALIGSKRAVDALYNNLTQQDLTIRYEAIRGLNKLKDLYPMIRIDYRLVEKTIVAETQTYYKTNAILFRLNRHASRVRISQSAKAAKGSRARLLLIEALQESLDHILERMFRLLGLIYNSRDIYNSYLGVNSGKPGLRTDAVEFLDNILASNLKKYVIPISEVISCRFLIDPANRLLDFRLSSTDEGLRMILKGDHRWLISCALYFIAEQGNLRHLGMIKDLCRSADGVIAETAGLALAKLGKSRH
jgi:AAA family ATP:ADP antiporter